MLDFLYLAQYPVHSTEMLGSLENALRCFHDNKQIFVDLGISNNFNLPKLHACSHYHMFIERYGTTDNYSTEYTKRLHIDTTKDAYSATNHKDEYSQMTVWLEHKEQIMGHDRFIRRRLSTGAAPTFSTISSSTMKHPPVLVPHRELKMARHASRNGVTFSQLVEEYGAKDFLYTLGEYIAQARSPGTRLNTAALQNATRGVLAYVPFYKVNVFHRIKFTECDPYSITRAPKYIVDSIHAEPEKRDKYGHVIPGRFDVALIQMRTMDGIHDSVKGGCFAYLFRCVLGST
ncbi:hypothetical protein VNI00_016034 [Paramarasmius palmivorus]|uniref:Uncharacterized protein n=1 Tax=Paramarasmius palmivorus TaxID=297713 RepID=A0AAW0BGA4_9AGAR